MVAADKKRRAEEEDLSSDSLPTAQRDRPLLLGIDTDKKR